MFRIRRQEVLCSKTRCSAWKKKFFKLARIWDLKEIKTPPQTLMYIVQKIVGISKAKKATKIPGHLFSSKLRRTSECLKIKDFNPVLLFGNFSRVEKWMKRIQKLESWSGVSNSSLSLMGVVVLDKKAGWGCQTGVKVFKDSNSIAVKVTKWHCAKLYNWPENPNPKA